jgi:protein YIPF6
MKQVLWPKYLLGGMLQRQGAGMGDVESQGFGRDIRGLVGRWPDADGILEGGLSEGLRDWDLWFVCPILIDLHTDKHRGPLIFCLLLSMFLSLRASKDQADLVFSGVFSIVWIGEAVVTLQIKLLGGNMYASALSISFSY